MYVCYLPISFFIHSFKFIHRESVAQSLFEASNFYVINDSYMYTTAVQHNLKPPLRDTFTYIIVHVAIVLLLTCSTSEQVDYPGIRKVPYRLAKLIS